VTPLVGKWPSNSSPALYVSAIRSEQQDREAASLSGDVYPEEVALGEGQLDVHRPLVCLGADIDLSDADLRALVAPANTGRNGAVSRRPNTVSEIDTNIMCYDRLRHLASGHKKMYA
jgi:hypothetical protein